MSIRIVIFMTIIVLISACNSQGNKRGLGSHSSASWAYSFVIWNDDIYRILPDVVKPDDIGEEIGEVKLYSDIEGMYTNGFSNEFPVGSTTQRAAI